MLRPVQVSGTQHVPPHWPAFPPPPQISQPGQVPQVAMVPPQPSGMAVPHEKPRLEHVWGVHAPASTAPHVPGVPPPPQVSGGVQVPQFAVLPPQPSGYGPPQVNPRLPQVSGTHGVPPQVPATPPPPQVSGAVQVPQTAVMPPQLSG
jgi:hypothetical protein